MSVANLSSPWLYTGIMLDHFHIEYFILDKGKVIDLDRPSSGFKMLNCYENAGTKKTLTG